MSQFDPENSSLKLESSFKKLTKKSLFKKKKIDDVTHRKEPVSFTCRPVTGTIGDLLKEIKDEDKGVDHAAVFAQVN